MTMLFRRYIYYLRSIPTLLTGITNWPSVVALFVRLPVPRPLTIRLRSTGLRLKVRTPMDVWVVKETCLDREYERVSVPVEDGWKVLDIGAGVGDFALDTAARHPATRIHAYEPSPESFRLLQENLRLNLLANVIAFQEAIGAGPTSVTLDVSQPEAVQHTIAGGASAGAIPVPAITLTQALVRLDGHCDLLKIDCEGAEYEILLTASGDTLLGVSRIVMEYHDNVRGHLHQELVTFLEGKGFRVRRYPSAVQPHLGLLYASRTATS
jgi:FkbM family methyltransferase